MAKKVEDNVTDGQAREDPAESEPAMDDEIAVVSATKAANSGAVKNNKANSATSTTGTKPKGRPLKQTTKQAKAATKQDEAVTEVAEEDGEEDTIAVTSMPAKQQTRKRKAPADGDEIEVAAPKAKSKKQDTSAPVASAPAASAPAASAPAAAAGRRTRSTRAKAKVGK